MALFGKVDNAANSPISTAGGLNRIANTANRTALFGNTTSGAFVSGQKVGVFGIDAVEVGVASGDGTLAAHAGWNLRREGTGQRAGRVTMETLVAMGSMTGDAEDIIAPDS